VSRSLTDPSWSNTRVLDGDLVAGVAALTRHYGREVQVLGSRTVAQALVAAGLVDEYRLWPLPVVVGDGKRLLAPRRTCTGSTSSRRDGRGPGSRFTPTAGPGTAPVPR
jgi:dihydrofolate reductase